MRTLSLKLERNPLGVMPVGREELAKSGRKVKGSGRKEASEEVQVVGEAEVGVEDPQEVPLRAETIVVVLGAITGVAAAVAAVGLRNRRGMIQT
jgi:hypothetical protein